MIEAKDIQTVLRSATLKDWMQMDLMRYVVGKRRYEENKDKLAIVESGQGLYPDALSLNLKGLENFNVVNRINSLAKPLAAIDALFHFPDRFKVLSVGPRTEMELFALFGMGFLPENVTGLDLFSYSPFVKVGNIMEAPFPDNTFDVVIAGWVLVYCSDPVKACAEIARVAKPNAVIAVGSTFVPEDRREAEANGRGEQFYPRTHEILNRFDVGEVYTRYDPPSGHKGRCIVIFRQRKSETAQSTQVAQPSQTDQKGP